MKQDSEVIFYLLKYAEQCPGGIPLVLAHGSYGGKHIALPSTRQNFQNLYEHILLLGDLGLAKVRSLGITFDGPSGAVIDRLTAKGHQRLDDMKKQQTSGPIETENPTEDLSAITQMQAKTRNLSQEFAKLPKPTSFRMATITNTEKINNQNMDHGKIFIGHGRSMVWRDLKDFIRERLDLTPVEFNSVATAGRSTKERLIEMLDEAVFAFIVMTAEDEDSDGKYHPRANVVHEAGLFQGRLGFERAIILLEEGCTEFSNVHGLTQIRFPKENK